MREQFVCKRCGYIVIERDYEEYTWYKALEDLELCEKCAQNGT